MKLCSPCVSCCFGVRVLPSLPSRLVAAVWSVLNATECVCMFVCALLYEIFEMCVR